MYLLFWQQLTPRIDPSLHLLPLKTSMIDHKPASGMMKGSRSLGAMSTASAVGPEWSSVSYFCETSSVAESATKSGMSGKYGDDSCGCWLGGWLPMMRSSFPVCPIGSIGPLTIFSSIRSCCGCGVDVGVGVVVVVVVETAVVVVILVSSVTISSTIRTSVSVFDVFTARSLVKTFFSSFSFFLSFFGGSETPYLPPCDEKNCLWQKYFGLRLNCKGLGVVVSVLQSRLICCMFKACKASN